MHVYCHRCANEITATDGNSPFCPHCGAPQLYLPDYEIQNDQGEASTTDTTGALPPPRLPVIDWRAAIQCALSVAAIAAALALLSARVQAASALSWLWMLSGSMITLAFYQRRRPLAWMDAGIGARIGVVVGLALVASYALVIGIGGVVARFGLHTMAGFDTQMTTMLHQQVEKAQATTPTTPQLISFLYSPEVKAGMMLTGLAMISGVVMLLSTVGGALGGFLRTRRKLPA